MLDSDHSLPGGAAEALGRTTRTLRVDLLGVVAPHEPPGRVVLVCSTLAAAGSTNEASHGEAFELVLRDGSTVRVDLEDFPSDGLSAPKTSERGTWRQVEQTALARPFRGRGPGPHVKVTVDGACVATGDEVLVIGMPTDEQLEAGEDAYRERRILRLSEVRATRVAKGAAAIEQARAAAKLAKTSRERPRRRLPSKKSLLIGALVIIVLAALGSALLRDPWLWATWGAGLSSAVIFGLSVSRDTDSPGAPAAGETFLDIIAAIQLFIALAMLLGAHAVALAAGGQSMAGMSAAAFAVAGILACLGAARATRQPRRHARIMLDAPAHTETSMDGDWERFCGTVEDPTPVRVSGVAAAMSRVVSQGETSVVVDDTFVLVSDERRIEVDPSDAIWSSTARRSVPMLEDPMGRVLEEIPVGARALVVGRKRNQGGRARIAASGPESLFIFAVPEREEPLDTLRRWQASDRRNQRLQLALCCLAVTLSVLALAATLPHAPR
ncbi:MAG: MFS transporter [Myxococcales bacterium]|nr:MFS transporter [Myxococcales bacterium]